LKRADESFISREIECETGNGRLFARFAAKARWCRAVLTVFDICALRLFRRVFDFLRRGPGIPRLRAWPKGAALWNPAAFEKAGETFFCASRASVQPLIRILIASNRWEGIAMEGKEKRRLPGLVSVLAAVTLLLTTGASGGGTVSSPLAEAAEPVRAKAASAAVMHAAAPAPMGKAAPEKDEEPEEASLVVPETAAVEDTYFDDAVFLGDSRTEGLFLYSGIKSGTPFTAVGATVESVFSKQTFQTENGGKVPLLDAMADRDCGKIYIMLGVNELGWSKIQNYHDQYAKLIDRLRADHPEAKIALQSLPPVSAKQDEKKTYVNNERIKAYNEVIRTLAEEKACYFLDVAACLTGGDGVLPVKQTTDGVHFNKAGCRTWLSYLRTHSLEDDAIAAALEAEKA